MSHLNFNIVMKCLNLQDHQAKTHNYRKGLAYLKKQGNHKPKPNIAFTKNEKNKNKKATQADNNWRPSNQKKKEWRTIESTGT